MFPVLIKEIEVKRNILALLVLFIFIFTGCESDSDVRDNRQSNSDKNVSGTSAESDYPEWFLNQPKSEDSVYGVGIAKKQNPQLAIDTATARARNEIARVIKLKVSTMTKDFLQESGAGEKAQSTEFTQVVSKQIADNVISGTQREKVFVDKTTEPNTFYVLVKLDLKDMSSAIDDVVKTNSSSYSKLQANKAFEELAKELKELKSSNFETPKIINEDSESK
jgi:hypothetical protein